MFMKIPPLSYTSLSVFLASLIAYLASARPSNPPAGPNERAAYTRRRRALQPYSARLAAILPILAVGAAPRWHLPQAERDPRNSSMKVLDVWWGPQLGFMS